MDNEQFKAPAGHQVSALTKKQWWPLCTSSSVIEAGETESTLSATSQLA